MTMPDRPLSREEEYLASISGQDGVKPDRPLSRKEEYLDAIDSHLDTKADLVDGKIPASELPSYVDDVIEGYYHDSKFYEDAQYTEEITPESSKIYIDLATGYTYRWGGTEYVQIGGGGDSSPIKLLTTADYNYPDNNPVGIALNRLPTGIYMCSSEDVPNNVWAFDQPGSSPSLETRGFAVVNRYYGSTHTSVFMFNTDSMKICYTNNGSTWNIKSVSLS